MPPPVGHGLVVGKFYPPHAGHHLLVRAAAALCRRLTVLVAASSVESIPLARRVAWMREVHPEPHVAVHGIVDEHPVDLESDAVWRAHVALFLAGAREVTAEPIDAVFSSEAYGEELGRRLGARAVGVDLARELVPVSATAIRRDPVAGWEHLAPPVRGGLARRVAVVGAESTGKTTLAHELAAALRARGGAHGATRVVPEIGRDVTIDKLARARAAAALAGAPRPRVESLVWETADFVAIAAAQNAREDAEARLGGPVLVCDTDARATGVWHERYVGARAAEVEAAARPTDLTLLTHPEDVPFTQDGLRDGARLRGWMTDTFVERLAGSRWRWVRGAREDRLAAALAAVDELLAGGWNLADPR
jgi:HTH-type transcriptional repressor of NAD biosynthesis genes